MQCDKFFYNFISKNNISSATMNLEFSPCEQTPVKAQKIYLSFSSEQTLGNTGIIPKSFNSQKDLCSTSPSKTSDPFKLLSSNKSIESSPEKDLTHGGDRYIPKRKLVKKQSMMAQDDRDIEAENKGFINEESGVVVSDLYRRFVMSESPKKRKIQSIQSFENNNILRFGSKNTALQETKLVSEQTGLAWTNNVDKEKPNGRKINKVPVKVLDAPSLQDDYYLNLLDWGSQNLMAVGLSSTVYLWNAATAKVNKLCDLHQHKVTSVSWGVRDPNIAVGGESGDVQIWDINKMSKIRTFTGHTHRVGSLNWSSSMLSSGSRDKNILNRDLRDSRQFISIFEGHKQEVCGLKWSPDQQMLCSGGNDNKLLVWSPKASEPLVKYCDHLAAVKAVAWSPHQHGMLVSGGGTADRTIRFRNTLTGSTTKVVQAGSQVCSLMFSKVSQQLVSTHGYQLNEINLWKVPNMSKVATLTGHSSRVLYLAMSADGSTIVTGAGDETLRFWSLFPSKNESKSKGGCLLQSQSLFLR